MPKSQNDTNAKIVFDKLRPVTLDKDEISVSLHVKSLFTNVLVREAIDVNAELLCTSGVKMPPVNKTTFLELLEFVSINALFLTESGCYRQADDVAMRSPVGPLLANVFLSQFGEEIGFYSFFSATLMTF